MTTEESAVPKDSSGHWWLWVLGLVSVVYGFGAGCYFFTAVDADGALKYTALSLGETGDFAAGTFSPLAFVWFVTAVMLQWRELKLQRLDLTETRRIAGEQAIAQQATSRTARQQIYLNIVEAAEEAVEALLIEKQHFLRSYLDPAYLEIMGGRLVTGAEATSLIPQLAAIIDKDHDAAARAVTPDALNVLKDIQDCIGYAEFEASEQGMESHFNKLFMRTRYGILYGNSVAIINTHKMLTKP